MWRQRLSTWWNRPSGGREVLAVALPLVVSTASWQIMQFTDRTFLVWYSPDAVGAALPAGVLHFVSICFFLGLGSYTTTFVAQYFGAGRHERIGLAVWQGVWIGLAVVPIQLATIPLATALFHASGHPPAVVKLEVLYYSIMAFGGGAFVISAALSSFFTGRGKVRIVMAVDSLAAAINIVLDWAWIFGKWGFPEWGVAGAAWATVVALWIKTAIYLALVLQQKYRAPYGVVSGCRFDRPLFLRLLRFGSPSGLQFLLEMSGFTVFVLLVGQLGADVLTATNLAFNVNGLAFMPIYGFGMAATTLVGQRLGENRSDLAARATWTTFWLSSVYTLTMSALYVLAPDLFLLGYKAYSDPVQFAALHDLTVMLLRYVAAYCLLDSVNVIFVSAIKGAGDTRFVMWATLLTSGGAAFAVWLGIGVLQPRFGLPMSFGLHWAWTSITVWICLLGVIYLARFLQGKWRTMRVIEPELALDLDEPLPGESEGETASADDAGLRLSMRSSTVQFTAPDLDAPLDELPECTP